MNEKNVNEKDLNEKELNVQDSTKVLTEELEQKDLGKLSGYNVESETVKKNGNIGREPAVYGAEQITEEPGAYGAEQITRGSGAYGVEQITRESAVYGAEQITRESGAYGAEQITGEPDTYRVVGEVVKESGVYGARQTEEKVVREPDVYGAMQVVSRTGQMNRQAGDKTLEDYIALPEGARVEMIDGVFYDMAAPTFVHQRVSYLIGKAFDNYISVNGGRCIMSIAPTDVQLNCDNRTMVQPDVLVVCDRKKLTQERVVGVPDLVVEVVSPGNHQMDEILKLMKYRDAGVREYWLVFPEEKRVVVYPFETSIEPVTYSFEQKVPVGIWKGDCEVDFQEIYEQIRFLYETDEEDMRR